VPNSELVFGTLTQNRSSLEPSLEFAAIAAARRALRTAGPEKVVAHQAGRQRCVGPASRPQLDPKTLGRMLCGLASYPQNQATVPPFSMRGVPRQSRQIQEKAQDYSSFGLKSQTPTPNSAQLASLARARGTYWSNNVSVGCPR
jgi:hypothetical protein